jgi:hypothetical protein
MNEAICTLIIVAVIFVFAGLYYVGNKLGIGIFRGIKNFIKWTCFRLSKKDYWDYKD